MILNYKKVKKVKSPAIGTKYSAGIDLFVPEFTEDFIKDFSTKNDPLLSTLLQNPGDNKIAIYPHCRALIPSGLVVNMEAQEEYESAEHCKFVLINYNKSGVSTKFGLDALACVIDEDYSGEVHISLVNTLRQKTPPQFHGQGSR